MRCSRPPLLACLQGHPLLAAKQAANDSSGPVVVPLIRGSAVLPDLAVTGSSEAILQGQKPPFVLLVRALPAATAGAGELGEGSAGGPAAATGDGSIPPTVSDGFVVRLPSPARAGCCQWCLVVAPGCAPWDSAEPLHPFVSTPLAAGGHTADPHRRQEGYSSLE